MRPEEEYAYAHIWGARSVPLEKLKIYIRNLPRDKKIIAYCRGPYCALSMDTVKLLRKNRLRAYRMPEGMDGSNRMKVERGPENNSFKN